MYLFELWFSSGICPGVFVVVCVCVCVCVMEYYSAINRNEIMPFVATWVDLEIIILSEVGKRKTNTI